jgi:hypothetical protein
MENGSEDEGGEKAEDRIIGGVGSVGGGRPRKTTSSSSSTTNPSSSDDDGTRTEISRSSSSREWRWENAGQCVAIGVPYRRGRHCATNIKDFTPILKHLRRLHELGFVHGDVRGFNMAMINENEGFLIDLDYGGKVICDVGNPPRYPEGYNYLLVDGARDKRPERSHVTRKDDVHAIATFMFLLFKPVQYLPEPVNDRQESLLNRATSVGEASAKDVTNLMNDMLRFVNESCWDVTPATPLFRSALVTFGYDL